MTIFAWGSVLVVLLVLTASLILFIQRRYFILAPERLNIFFSFIITNCFNDCYTAFPWLPVSNILDFKFYCKIIFFLLWKWSQVKESEILVHNVLKSCVINISIEMKLLIISFPTELSNFLVRQEGLSVLIRFFLFLRKGIKSSRLFTNYSNQRRRLNPSKTL